MGAYFNAVHSLDQAFAVELAGFARAGLWGLQHLTSFRDVNRILQTYRRSSLNWRSIQLVRVLSPSLRDLKRGKDKRLAWLLAQETRTFCVAVVDNCGFGNHAVGMLTDQFGRRVIFDSEERVALPLGMAGLTSVL